MSNRKSLGLTIGVALMLVLAGCSGGTGAGGGTSTATSEADTATMTEAQTKTTTGKSSLTEPKEATIVGIVDGDTYKVKFSDGTKKNISLLGVKAPASSPEEVDPADFGMKDTADARKHLAQYGAQLEKELENQIVGSSITVVYDTEASKQRDADGNRLAYIAVTGDPVNGEILQKGFGTTTDTQHEKAQEFDRILTSAKQNGRGLWAYSG